MLAAVLATSQPVGANTEYVEVTIMEIQGDGHLSPLDGTHVKTSGVVTAVAFSSFFIQDPVGDGDDNTSDGILIASRDDVAVGDIIEVIGDVDEQAFGTDLSTTRLVGVTFDVVSSGNPLPAPVEIGRNGRLPSSDTVISDSELPTNLQTDAAVSNPEVDAIDFYESLEGMHVEIDRPQAVSGTRTFNRFSSEVFTVPNIRQTVRPANARTQRGGILLNADPDNTGDQNPERVQIQFDGTIFPGPVPDIDVGDRLGDVRGVLGYSFGNYEVNATEVFNVTKSALGTQQSPLTPRSDEVTVASYNVLNLDPLAGDDAQRALIAKQIVDDLRSPDVVALQEIQDNNGTVDDGTTAADLTLQALVDAIAAAGGPAYEAFDVAPEDLAGGGVPGGNIRNAFLYNPDRVDLVEYFSGTPETLADIGVSNPDAFVGTRDPLVAAFSFNGDYFTVINNHLTSRFGSSAIYGAVQPFIQAGEDERGAEVGALNEMVDIAQAEAPGASIMVVGDLNTFEWTNELAEILPGDGVLTNLITDNALLSQDRKNRYTFNFEGNSQALDHFFVTDGLLGHRTKLDIVHQNVDFSRLGTDVVASDHEPLLARFRLPDAPVWPSQLVDLQLLGFNDYHGHVTGDTSGFVSFPNRWGGGEYLSSKLNELREGNEHSLTVAAGDLIGGSPAFSGLFHDEPSVESLNAMHLDISGVGNHEFDEGVTELLRMQNGGCHPVDGCYFPNEPYAGADFQWLSANVVETATGNTPLPEYSVEVIDGVKVGFIGMTLEATDTLVAASGIQGYDFLDEAETANALVPQLHAEGVDAIVVLLHEGGSQTPPPGDLDACVGISGPVVAIHNTLDPAIDVMVTGHTHLPYNCKLDDSAGNPRIVTSSYSFGRVVTEIDLVLDKRTNDVRRDLSSATNHVVLQSDITPDPVISSVIAKWQPLFDEIGLEVVGSASADINRGGNPPGSDRGVESAAGNLIADAQLWATAVQAPNGADVAFMNPGGVRTDLLAGDITFGDAFSFQPFNNILYTVPMTGAQIVAALEDQCQPLGSSRPILHLGVSDGFTYDLATTVVGGDCTSITISNVMLGGAALVPTDTYGVTVNGFLADGGDNFGTFATIDPFLRIDGGIDIDALVDYIGENSPVAPPSTDRVNEQP